MARYANDESEAAVDRRLGEEARRDFLGDLGHADGANVAKVEVQWYVEYDDGTVEYHAGHFAARATGNEPECEGEEGTIYGVFERLVSDEMDARQERGAFDGWETLDTSAW